ncbi:MAG: IS110 family transposase [Chloroflexi bacterium]|nr:IS110 family transposase [Chloroflexota bacterium]
MSTTLHSENKLFVAIELSNTKWRLAFSTSAGGTTRQRVIAARSRTGFLAEIHLAKSKLDLPDSALTVCCYEAGRDGFWIQRWLTREGFECLMLDPASIEVNRKKRRAKTDRLDAESLVRLLKRYIHGDEDLFSVVRIPSPEQEDQMRLARELERLKKERSSHTNRIKSLLILHGLYINGSLSALRKQIDTLRLWNGEPLPEGLKHEILRELDRYDQIVSHIHLLEKRKSSELKHPHTNAQKQTRDLLHLRGVGEVSAWSLSHEFFGWREFKNRKEVASLAGLTPTPYDSGDSCVEQGISKAGNRRVRRIMIELAWSWLRFQPNSELSKWFEKRFGHGSKRMRRIGIVALARKLLVALWRYVEFSEIPAGAVVV